MKNRILILTGVFLEGIGGPSTLLKALNLELIKRGYQVTVLTCGKRKQAKDYSYPVKVVSNKWPSFLKSFLYLIKGFWLALKSDIIYNQDLYTAGLTALLIKRFLGKKLVTRFVGDSAWEIALNRGETTDNIMDFQINRYSKLIERRKKIRKKILVNSDKIIVVSNFLKELAVKIGVSEEKIKVIYNSIDFLVVPSDSKVDLKKQLNIIDKVILTNARLTPWKGIDMLIKIMPELIKKYKDIRLVIISEGPERINLEKLAVDLDVEEYIFFAGRVSRELVVEYLKISDVFVLNTNYEGMSFVILEAMKVGTPVITTKAGGNPETIKDKETGILVNYQNKKQWLEAINQILDNPDLAEKLVVNAQQDLRRFSWDDLIKKTILVFENA
ncbi:glycosyltransferase family 4 protein [Patescibacteria group bacterium]|nr:glycosyltransferase family 4 protein [Patescibacteria group bacterium]